MLENFLMAIIFAVIIRFSGIEEITLGDFTIKFGGNKKPPKQLKK